MEHTLLLMQMRSIRRFFVKVITPLDDFAGIDWSAQQSQGEPFA